VTPGTHKEGGNTQIVKCQALGKVAGWTGRASPMAGEKLGWGMEGKKKGKPWGSKVPIIQDDVRVLAH